MSRVDRLPIGAAFQEPRAQMAVSPVGTTSHRDLPKPTGLADGLEVGSPRLAIAREASDGGFAPGAWCAAWVPRAAERPLRLPSG
jgi:hypothetical protein